MDPSLSLKLGYGALSLGMSAVLVAVGFYAIRRSVDASRARRYRVMGVALLLTWHAYLFTLGASGILRTHSFPPRFVLLTILPAFVATGVFVARHRRSAWLQQIPPHWLLYYQSFRVLIESLFIGSVSAGLLHFHVTLLGYNYDLVFAALTPVVAFAVFQAKVLPRVVALAWNYIGLAVITVILFLFFSTIYMPGLYGASEPLLPLDALTHPFILVPGFLMPSAVFVHVLSIAQLTYANVQRSKSKASKTSASSS